MKKLGFGLMRLPKINDQIDIERTAALANSFLEQGFIYFDTAYVYPGSEVAFRQAIGGRHDRKEYLLANKLPVWEMKKAEDAEKIFAESLSRCGVDYFDYYMVHSITDDKVQEIRDLGLFDFCRRKKEEGKVKKIGFSFHGSNEVLETLLKEHPDVDFVQLQINYLDWDNGIIASGKNYETVRRHGKDIIVMEPVKGGTLATLKPEAEAEFAAVAPGSSPASFALRFAGTLPGVIMVLSGMSNEEQVADNLNTFTDLKPLTTAENEAIDRVCRITLDSPVIGCTACGYCEKGCPMNIPIPAVFKAYNKQLLSADGMETYRKVTDGKGVAADCIGCAACEEICPQHLPIVDTLAAAAKVFNK